jgi:hypothetical protein
MTENKQVKDKDKPSAPRDWGFILKLLWSDDKGRNWEIYTVQQSRPFWDVHNREPQSR